MSGELSSWVLGGVLGLVAFEDVKDPALQNLIAEGTSDELLPWLEQHP
jgi:hypothetical protein